MAPFLSGAAGVVSRGRWFVSDHPAARDEKQSLASAPPVSGGEIALLQRR